MTQANLFDKLLAGLYAAPTRPELWGVFLKEFGAVSRVEKAALISHRFADNNHRMLAALGDCVKDRENVRLYEDLYYQLDEWTLRFPRRGDTGRIVQGQDIWPRGALLKSAFYNEFLKKVDICHMACVAVVGPPGILEALSIYRGPGEDEFDREQLAALELILPHLKIALYTRRKLLELESRVSEMETALDRLNTALVLVDTAAKVSFANKSARIILDRRDGLVFDCGELMAQDATEGAALRATLVNATSRGARKAPPLAQAMVISRDQKRPLQIVAVPCQPETLAMPRKAVALVFITDPDEKPPARPETLRLLFGLTRAEIKLALVLLDGKSLSEAAELNEVGRETVRSQLKSIFLKTGTRRQSELIGLLTRLPDNDTGLIR
jgi:DNA-binding CsgD family transcriptional regulator